ncbi:hypothetical protein [Streptomyces sp. NPDC127114]|uniref:hypothetical protein n=1 Tax=Streptomyces sp. NPDC127114 TaxID=3345366 RepID=UPI0036452D7C
MKLTDDAESEHRLSGWMTDANTLARLTTDTTGASIRRLTAPGTDPLAVPHGLQVIERLRAGSGDLLMTLARPAAYAVAAQRPGQHTGPPRAAVHRPEHRVWPAQQACAGHIPPRTAPATPPFRRHCRPSSTSASVTRC